jgi:hypothetical protein
MTAIIYEQNSGRPAVIFPALADRGPEESEADFIARIVAAQVPSGSRHIVVSNLPDGQQEHFVIDWVEGSITIDNSALLKSYAAEKRWNKEVGGTLVNGVPVPTDDRAKLLLLGAATSMVDGSSSNLVIAGVNYGVFTKIQIQALNDAVVAHVQATFPLLATVLAGIDAGTITTMEQIDTAFA